MLWRQGPTCITVCSEVGKIFKLVRKDSARCVLGFAPGHIHGVLWMGDGHGPETNHLSTCRNQHKHIRHPGSSDKLTRSSAVLQ